MKRARFSSYGADRAVTWCAQEHPVHNRPEFISRGARPLSVREWRRARLSRPGKPTDNAFVESFNARLRDECLNTH